MRKLALVILLVLAVATLALAGPKGKKYKEHTIHGFKYDRRAVERLLDDSEVPGDVTAYDDGVKKLNGKFKLDKSMKVEDAAIDFIDRHRNAFKLKNPKDELKITRIENHKEGDIHVRYNQTYNGVPIWGQEIIVHINKEHDLDRAIFDSVPTPDIDTTPLITEEEAIEIVKQDLFNKFGKKPKGTRKPKLYIYNNELVYSIFVGGVGSWEYLIDARTGNVVKAIDRVYVD